MTSHEFIGNVFTLSHAKIESLIMNLLQDMLLEDWNLTLADWGLELTLLLNQQVLIPESQTFDETLVSLPLRGIMLQEKQQPLTQTQISWNSTQVQFMVGLADLPAEPPISQGMICLRDQYYAINSVEQRIVTAILTCEKRSAPHDQH
jgi:hypothetical protein